MRLTKIRLGVPGSVYTEYKADLFWNLKSNLPSMPDVVDIEWAISSVGREVDRIGARLITEYGV